ncbi:peptidoglycan DD-metalloendopeptidase family protein [Brevundimonas sp.]|uniref:peptidoglycan DD-metalloendopeptidase family protein n=1 Tax=Brevundimonas sp. TaxID=1871086 RepID=UPI0025F539AE|nr:peptidoglycan DD-metalloendopeptidase family protein [Brevundimonas sp.]
MAQFDPRRQPVRVSPHLFTVCAAVAVAALVWRVYQPLETAAQAAGLTPVQLAQLESQAFAAASAPDGLTNPEIVPVEVRSGETLEQAVQRTGVDANEARAVVRSLADGFDVVNIRAGLRFETAVARPRSGGGSARLIGLTLRTGPATQLTVTRNFDGALRVRELAEQVTQETTVASGEIHGSLHQSAVALGADSSVVARVVQLFAHRLDFSRDIRAGDPFTMVFERTVTESGVTVDTGELLYAELKGVRFYRYQPAGASQAQYFDEEGKNIRGFLLQTPIDGARISSNYGMRRHPIAGYRRMHQGIDFAAGYGTPVVAAADGVVVEARRWGGYGNWVRIRHSDGWETGYAHLSRYGSGIRAGQRVQQGQIIAYVGSTGASTGPHLHYELWRHGQRVNPRGARVPQGTILTGRELAAFQAQRARIDAMIAERQGGGAVQQAAVAELRPAQG